MNSGSFELILRVPVNGLLYLTLLTFLNSKLKYPYLFTVNSKLDSNNCVFDGSSSSSNPSLPET